MPPRCPDEPRTEWRTGPCSSLEFRETFADQLVVQNVVPEPSVFLLVSCGLIIVAASRRRQAQA